MLGASEPAPSRVVVRSRRWRRSLGVTAAALAGILLVCRGPVPAGGEPGGGPGIHPAAAAARRDQPAPPPDPGQAGGYAVGYQTLLVPNPGRPQRALMTSVWYPSPAGHTVGGGGPGAGHGRSGTGRGAAWAVPAPVGVPARYPVIPGIAVPAATARQEVPVAPGRFPLVVVSHGSAGSGVQLAYLAEALASHGFVVAAPDHPGDTMIEVAEGRQAPLVDLASDRLLDVSTVIGAFTDEDCPLATMVDADRVGVVGFSFGGLTSVVSPVGFLRAPADPRVRAVVGIAAATEVVPADLLRRVRVPALLIGGRMDGAVPFERNTLRAFGELTGAHPRYLVTVPGGTHNSFTEICAQAAAARGHDVPDGVRVRIEVTEKLTCRPPAIGAAQAQRLTAYYTVAFLESRLAGASGYDRYLTSAAASRLPNGEFRAVG